MHSRMPVGHADAERQSGRAGMWRTGWKRRGAAGAARRRLLCSQRWVRELVSSGMHDRGAVGRQKRDEAARSSSGPDRRRAARGSAAGAPNKRVGPALFENGAGMARTMCFERQERWA